MIADYTLWRVHAVTESEFNDLVDETFEALAEALDEVDGDIDYEDSGGVLTVQFENGTTMVFSRQPPTCQLWLAARSGGYHFTHDSAASDWRDTRTDTLLKPFVVEQMKSQGGVDLDWI
ncbi:MAG: iron donor protein CyaY [Halioglobus sp.]|nr:iron donor protein CyaY [Halioglobus sp.]